MGSLNKAPSLNMGEEAYRAIIRKILGGTFHPGELLREVDLAEQLGISRTPVSVALNRLVSEGFLEKRKKNGCVIPVPSADDARKVFYARQVIEGQTAAAAARNASPEDLAELGRALEIQAQSLATNSRELFSSSNEAFHMGIARMSGNPYFERYCRHAFWRSNLYVFFFDAFYTHLKHAGPGSKTSIHHRQILDAIAGRDAEEARRLMEQHVMVTYEGLLVS
jgi:DNA-binding GntR family transcriptional regulator